MSASGRRTSASPTSPSPDGALALARGSRRAFLGQALALCAASPLAALVGCGGAPAPRPPSPRAPEIPPLEIKRLTDLLALARLRSLVLCRPREIAAIPWLIPPIGTVVTEERFGRFAESTGLDLRQLPEAALATYDAGGGEEVTIYLARHRADALGIERRFRARLVADEHRVVERPDLVRVSGKVGSTPQTMVVLGRDVVGFQQGGSPSRGPARVAALYATGKLRRSPTVLAEDPLRALSARFGSAPASAYALGPFEGELARGARGLLAGATAIGAAARPSAREGIALVIAVAGDFSASGAAASDELVLAWNELAQGTFGHLLSLDAPVEPPLATHAPDAVTVAVELNPRALAKGLAAATSARIDEIMR